jgi:hypothetical protein
VRSGFYFTIFLDKEGAQEEALKATEGREFLASQEGQVEKTVELRKRARPECRQAGRQVLKEKLTPWDAE